MPAVKGMLSMKAEIMALIHSIIVMAAVSCQSPGNALIQLTARSPNAAT